MATDTSQKKAPRQKQSSLFSSSFMTRLVYGLGYAVIFISVLFLGTIPTAIWVALMSGLCCFEFFRMAHKDGKVPNDVLGIAAAVLLPLAAIFNQELLNALVFGLVLVCGLWYVFNARTRMADACTTIAGPIYTGFMLSSIVLLREAVPGFAGGLLSVGTCASLWVSDSFAYLVGSRFGKHKMVPKISPNKSWEGFFGGILGSLLIWLILYFTGLYELNIFYAIFCSIVVAVMGVFGDLIESRIKRGVGVKDSGNIMPGHGGMLDRTDSLIFGVACARILLLIGGVI